MTSNLHLRLAVLAGAALLAGCSGDMASPFGGSGSGVTTAAIPETPKIDPACLTLASQIDGYRREGVADKVSQAAIKKYKMTPADLAKADLLNKANADFQARCSTLPKSTMTTAAAPAATTVVAPVAAKAAATPAVAKAAAKAPAAAAAVGAVAQGAVVPQQ